MVGSSPEVLVRVEDGVIMVWHIAGTRSRGVSEDADIMLEHELHSETKEQVKHLMLIDLGSKDVGRVANTGNVIARE